jgi:UDP-N-acetylglucosamine--N-acetylmuramyl-(pentapeptide) pyrophosphoryl-undecaprenol N-acetylglucosamine transferase
LGGSQGAQKINDVLIDALPELIKKYQIIHQTGAKNLEESKSRASIVIGSTQFSHRYKPFAFLNVLASKMAAGAASLIVSRAGSTLFEIALYGKPSIIIPITESNGDHQRKNAYAYARSGGAVVIEEANLTPNLLFSEIDSLLSNPLKLEKMASAAKSYGKPDAAYTIAKEIITIAIAHES